ncbi:MAG: endonuclease V [Planctomycetes bacterium]|nr:endonuclease V [Planctomycetota bacterium]
MPPRHLITPDLPAELTRLLTQIPPGRVATYGDLARALGHSGAARWVGEFLVDHAHHAACRCHRVVRSTGEPGRFIAGDERKPRLLRKEGIRFVGGRVDLSRYGFDELRGEAPLTRLVTFQKRIPKLVRERAVLRRPKLVAGLDVAYRNDGSACGAYVLLETNSAEIVWELTLSMPATFPYIPGLLSYRELPLLLTLIDEARRAGRLGEVLFVDGHGRLHPRRAGIAAHFGVLAGLPTIGIGKSLLCGTLNRAAVAPGRPQPVIHEDELIGMAAVSRDAGKPYYVSVGNLVDLSGAVSLAQRLSRGYRLPEPTRLADRLSRRAKREAPA